jgi:hypothetical protein
MTLLSGTVLALQQQPGDAHLTDIVFEVLRDGLRGQAVRT